MADLVFFSGPMDCGKSTLALQMAHTQASHDREGQLFGSQDRSGQAVISSRMGSIGLRASTSRPEVPRSSRCTARSPSSGASLPSRQTRRTGSPPASVGASTRWLTDFGTESAIPTRSGLAQRDAVLPTAADGEQVDRQHHDDSGEEARPHPPGTDALHDTLP